MTLPNPTRIAIKWSAIGFATGILGNELVSFLGVAISEGGVVFGTMFASLWAAVKEATSGKVVESANGN